MYYADPAQPLATAGEELSIDDLDHDLSEVSKATSILNHFSNEKHIPHYFQALCPEKIWA